jgi:hypothetical protein
MTTKATVTGEPVTSVVPEGMDGSGAAPAGVGATGVSDAGNENPAARIDALRKQYEQDLRKLQSTLDRNLAIERQQATEREQKLREQLEQVQTANMDEKERAIFEATKYRQQYEALQVQLQQQNALTQAQLEMQNYAAELQTEFGIGKEELDFSDQEAMAASAWTAIKKRVNGAQPAPASSTPATSVQPANNRILTTGPGTPPKTRVTHTDLKEGYEKRMGKRVTDEEYWRAAELGYIDMSQLSTEE